MQPHELDADGICSSCQTDDIKVVDLIKCTVCESIYHDYVLLKCQNSLDGILQKQEQEFYIQMRLVCYENRKWWSKLNKTAIKHAERGNHGIEQRIPIILKSSNHFLQS